MLKGILNPESWKENTGDKDYWEIIVENGNVFAKWDGSQNITLPNGKVINVNNDTGKLSASKLSQALFGGTGENSLIENLFNEKGLTWSDKTNSWNNTKGEAFNNDDLSLNITSLINNTTKYNKLFDNWLVNGMVGVNFSDMGGLPNGLFGYVNRKDLLTDVADVLGKHDGTSIEKVEYLRELGNKYINSSLNLDPIQGRAVNQYAMFFNEFVNHIGGSIAPDAQSMGFSDDFAENNEVNYSSKRNGEPTHTGGDTRQSVINTPIKAGFSGRIPTTTPFQITTLYSDTNSVLTYETGFEFGERFISTGVWIQDRHMNDMKEYTNDSFSSTEKLGRLNSVWDKGTIAAHLHMDIITDNRNSDALWFQNLFNARFVSDITWYNGNNTYNRTYWDPKDVWYNYWKEVK